VNKYNVGMVEMQPTRRVMIISLGIEVTDEQIISVPQHNIIRVDGSDTGILCPETTGIAQISKTFPTVTALVRCLNANRLGVRQCLKIWE